MRLGGLVFDVLAIATALASKFFTPSAAWIEADYSNGLYPPIDRAVRTLTDPLPFTLGDLLFIVALLALIAWWARRLLSAPKGKRLSRIGALALRTVAIAAFVYVWFNVSWAFNYSRIPLAEKIPVHNERTNEDSVTAFAEHVVVELNRNADVAHRILSTKHRDTNLDREKVSSHPHEFVEDIQALVPHFNNVIERLGDRSIFAPPRVKPTIFQPLFEASATSGFTDPWTHEVNLDASAFDFERPATYAHEWAHLAGFADESEANFIAVVACTTSHDPLLAYSGWMLTWFNLPPTIRVKHRLSRQAYKDVRAIIARYRKQVNPRVEKASRAAYDQYLKANRVKAGFASYHLFVRWLTAADYDRDGLPLVRPEPAL